MTLMDFHRPHDHGPHILHEFWTAKYNVLRIRATSPCKRSELDFLAKVTTSTILFLCGVHRCNGDDSHDSAKAFVEKPHQYRVRLSPGRYSQQCCAMLCCACLRCPAASAISAFEQPCSGL